MLLAAPWHFDLCKFVQALPPAAAPEKARRLAVLRRCLADHQGNWPGAGGARVNMPEGRGLAGRGGSGSGGSPALCVGSLTSLQHVHAPSIYIAPALGESLWGPPKFQPGSGQTGTNRHTTAATTQGKPT